MNLILGATGQIGSNIIHQLKNHRKAVRGIARNAQKAKALDGLEIKIADFFDVNALKEAFDGGHTVFLLTPENPQAQDVISDTKEILNNYREAILSTGIKRIVGLSSLGAQHRAGTGNLEMSYILEHAFDDLPIEKVFIRPAYYYSNWLGYLDSAREQGILPTFLPADLKIPMIAPTDVSHFIAEILLDENRREGLYEIVGPSKYSSSEVAETFGTLLKKKVEVAQLPREQWRETLLNFGFSKNGVDNLIKMIEAVIDKKTDPEKPMGVVKLKTDLNTYLSNVIG